MQLKHLSFLWLSAVDCHPLMMSWPSEIAAMNCFAYPQSSFMPAKDAGLASFLFLIHISCFWSLCCQLSGRNHRKCCPVRASPLGTASPALIFPLINEFRWRETGAHTDPCGSPYQPPLLCARKGFGPTSYKFLARLVLQSKNECPYSDK